MSEIFKEAKVILLHIRNVFTCKLRPNGFMGKFDSAAIKNKEPVKYAFLLSLGSRGNLLTDNLSFFKFSVL